MVSLIRLRQHTSQNTSQVMVIKMAAAAAAAGRGSTDHTDGDGDEASADGGAASASATVVCVVKYGTNGVLEISPDFSHGRKPYRIEVSTKKFV